MGGREVNKRTLENFIKAGAMDSPSGNRRQKTMIAPELLDQKNKDRKNVEGQLSLLILRQRKKSSNTRSPCRRYRSFRRENFWPSRRRNTWHLCRGHPMDEYLET